jgi:hypothetical protein
VAVAEAPKAMPPAKAAMKPEPPTASAAVNASAAAAAGTTFNQIGSARPRRPANTINAAATAPAPAPTRAP